MDITLDDKQLRALFVGGMVLDYPDLTALYDALDAIALQIGFVDWVDAYHGLPE